MVVFEELWDIFKKKGIFKIHCYWWHEFWEKNPIHKMSSMQNKSH